MRGSKRRAASEKPDPGPGWDGKHAFRLPAPQPLRRQRSWSANRTHASTRIGGELRASLEPNLPGRRPLANHVF